MFDMESRQTIVKSVVESADSALQSADSSGDSNVNPPKVGVWVGFSTEGSRQGLSEKHKVCRRS